MVFDDYCKNWFFFIFLSYTGRFRWPTGLSGRRQPFLPVRYRQLGTRLCPSDLSRSLHRSVLLLGLDKRHGRLLWTTQLPILEQTMIWHLHVFFFIKLNLIIIIITYISIRAFIVAYYAYTNINSLYNMCNVYCSVHLFNFIIQVFHLYFGFNEKKSISSHTETLKYFWTHYFMICISVYENIGNSNNK